MRFVSILMASKRDHEVMVEAAKILEKFGVAHELVIVSPHRSYERTHEYVKGAQKKGAKVFIAVTRVSLAGVVASLTTRAVIGVPVKSDSEAHTSVGVPIALMSFGKLGAVNSAYLAMQILALEDEELSVKLLEDRILKAKKVETDSDELEVRI